mmetsp:Transcript_24075/g.33642  ORF Transcript_24075/g.33642 Transcript_24075/m.33642 type:complete len:292 (+) Transcript_24075:52-927(+)
MPGFADYLKTSKRHSRSSFLQPTGATRKSTSSSEAVDGQKLGKKKKKKKRSSSINASAPSARPAPPQHRLRFTPSTSRPTKARGLKMKLSMIKETSREDLMESFRNYSKSFKKSVRNFGLSSRKLSIPEEDSTGSCNKQNNTREQDEIVPGASGENMALRESGKTVGTEASDENKIKVDKTNVSENREEKKLVDSITPAIITVTIQETDPAPECEEQESQVSSNSKKAKSTKSKHSTGNKKNNKKEDAFASWAKQTPQKTAGTSSTFKSGVKHNVHRTTHKKDAFAAWAKK